jgi:hypothetical protein
MAIKKFEAPEHAKAVFVNYMGKKEQKGQLQIMLFSNGEAIIETKAGENIFLTRAQTVDLYTFFGSPRVETRMLDVMRAHLWAAGGVCRELIRFIDKTPPRADQPAA